MSYHSAREYSARQEAFPLRLSPFAVRRASLCLVWCIGLLLFSPAPFPAFPRSTAPRKCGSPRSGRGRPPAAERASVGSSSRPGQAREPLHPYRRRSGASVEFPNPFRGTDPSPWIQNVSEPRPEGTVIRNRPVHGEEAAGSAPAQGLFPWDGTCLLPCCIATRYAAWNSPQQCNQVRCGTWNRWFSRSPVTFGSRPRLLQALLKVTM